jgi:hypothetical protein
VKIAREVVCPNKRQQIDHFFRIGIGINLFNIIGTFWKLEVPLKGQFECHQ